MNWRTITLRSVDNQYIIVPNANMVRTDVTNYSRPTAEQRLHVRIGLPYAAPPGTVKEVLLPAVQSAEGVSASPAPDVLAYEYGDSAILYDVRYWITDYSRTPEIRDAVLSRIWYALRRADIAVPFPIRDVTVRQVSEEYEQAAAARLRQRIFAHLRPLPLFAPFADEQVAQLAAHAKIQPYAAGEMLVTQGEVGDSLFVILSGQARVDVAGAGGAVSTLARRGPDDYFGEMSLLTGERRTASVIAESEMDVIIVDKTALADVLNANPESLRELSELAAQRLAEMRAHLDAAEVTGSRKDADSGTGLFSRIARFLGLDKA
jgi:CRP-like cAMP-binding protein